MMKSETGKEWEPCPDRAEIIARIVEMERRGETLAGAVDALAKGGQRITDADRILAVCGTDYAGFLDMGFRYEDLVKVVEAVYEAVGFTARRKASPRRTADA